MKVGLVWTAMLVAANAAQMGAQDAGAAVSTDAPSAWRQLAGCWSATSTSVESSVVGSNAVLCVLPVASDRLAADFVSFATGQEVRRSRVIADGVRRDFDSPDCEGHESARFSLDGARVLLAGEIRCDAQTDHRTSGIISLTESDRLLQVSGGDDARGEVRFRYHQRVAPGAVPEPARAVVNALTTAEAERKARTGVMFSASDVAELSSAVSVPVAEIWLAATAADAASPVEARPEFVQALADARVPDRVRMLLVALADPAGWSVSLSASGATVRSDADGTVRALRQLVDAYGGGASIAPGGTPVGRANGVGASSLAVANACLGAVLLTDGSFGAVGGAPAFAHVLFSRACPNSALYDPRLMNSVLYGAYGGSSGTYDSAGNPAPRKASDSGQAGEGTSAAGIARERNAGAQVDGGSSRGRPSSHPAPEAIPLGGVRGPAASPAPAAPATRAPAGSPRVPVP